MKIWLKKCPYSYNDYCTDMFLVDTEQKEIVEHVTLDTTIAKRNGHSTNQTAEQTIASIESEYDVNKNLTAVERWTALDGYVYTLFENGEEIKNLKLDDFIKQNKDVPSSKWFAAAVASMV